MEWKGALVIRDVADGGGRTARGVGRSRERQLQHHAEAIGKEHWRKGQCRTIRDELKREVGFEVEREHRQATMII